MQLKVVLENVPWLREILASTESPTFQDLYESLKDERYEYLLEKISEVLDTNNTMGCTKWFSRLYSVKPEINEILDAARTVYSNLIDKINETINRLATEYDLPVRMMYNMNWGFHMQLSLRQNNFNEVLPDVFEVLSKRGEKYFLTTAILKKTNHELKDIIDEIQIMSNV